MGEGGQWHDVLATAGLGLSHEVGDGFGPGLARRVEAAEQVDEPAGFGDGGVHGSGGEAEGGGVCALLVEAIRQPEDLRWHVCWVVAVLFHLRLAVTI